MYMCIKSHKKVINKILMRMQMDGKSLGIRQKKPAGRSQQETLKSRKYETSNLA